MWHTLTFDANCYFSFGEHRFSDARLKHCLFPCQKHERYYAQGPGSRGFK